MPKSNWTNVNPFSLAALKALEEKNYGEKDGFITVHQIAHDLGFPDDMRSARAIAQALKYLGWSRTRIPNQTGTGSKYQFAYLHPDGFAKVRRMTARRPRQKRVQNENK